MQDLRNTGGLRIRMRNGWGGMGMRTSANKRYISNMRPTLALILVVGCGFLWVGIGGLLHFL